MRIPSQVLKFVRVTTRELVTQLIRLAKDALIIGNDVVVDLRERTTVRQVYLSTLITTHRPPKRRPGVLYRT